MTNAEAFLTFSLKNPLKNILEIFFGSGLKGALYTFFIGMPLVYIVHSFSKKEQNIVWLASSCVEAGYSSIKDSDVQRIPALKNKVTNAININENELKKYEGEFKKRRYTGKRKRDNIRSSKKQRNIISSEKNWRGISFVN